MANPIYIDGYMRMVALETMVGTKGTSWAAVCRMEVIGGYMIPAELFKDQACKLLFYREILNKMKKVQNLFKSNYHREDLLDF